MFKKAVQRGRSERRGETYSCLYVEPLTDARTKLAAFFNILLEAALLFRRNAANHLDGGGRVGEETVLLIRGNVH